MYFTNDQRRILLLLKIDNRLSLRRTALAFHQQFPNLPIPSPKTISNLEAKFRATGSVFTRPKPGRPRSITNENNEVLVLGSVALKCQQSLKEISEEAGVSLTSAWRILKRHQFHPYGVTLTQELSEQDYERRMDFCELIEMQMREPHFVNNICFSDECTFHLSGYVNRHNMRYWCAENPHVHREEHTQTPRKVNVWAAILGRRIIGPYFFDGNVNRWTYLEMLEEYAVPLIEQAADEQNIDFDDVIFQQDGHPAHFALIVRDYLNQTFPNRWIERGGPTEWPPRSPDLTSLDFFLWGYLKDRVFRTKPETVEEMKNRIIENCRVPDDAMLDRVMGSFQERILMCISEEGKQFEHLLNR